MRTLTHAQALADTDRLSRLVLEHLAAAGGPVETDALEELEELDDTDRLTLRVVVLPRLRSAGKVRLVDGLASLPPSLS